MRGPQRAALPQRLAQRGIAKLRAGQASARPSGDSLPSRIFASGASAVRYSRVLVSQKFSWSCSRSRSTGRGSSRFFSTSGRRAVGVFRQARGWPACPVPRRRGRGRGHSRTGPSRSPPALPAGCRLGEGGAVVLRLGDLRPRVADLGGQFRVGIDLGPQFGLGAALGIDHRRIGQGLQLAAQGFKAVLDAEQIVGGDARVLRAFLGKAGVAAAQLGILQQRGRQHEIAQRLKLRHRQQPLGGARIAGDEHRLAGLRRRRRSRSGAAASRPACRSRRARRNEKSRS